MLNNNLATNILNEYKNDSITLAQAVDMLNILYTHPNPINTSTDTLEIPGNSQEILEEIQDIVKIKDILPSFGLDNTRANQMKAAEVLKEMGYEKIHTRTGSVWIK